MSSFLVDECAASRVIFGIGKVGVRACPIPSESETHPRGAGDSPGPLMRPRGGGGLSRDAVVGGGVVFREVGSLGSGLDEEGYWDCGPIPAELETHPRWSGGFAGTR